MIGRKLKTVFLLAILLITSGCSETFMTEKSDAEAIFWHERNRYTAAIKSNGSIEMHRIPSYGSVSIMEDATGKPWYECKWAYNRMFGSIDGNCNIHVSSIDTLRPGDWNHGKFGSGSTKRIDK